MTPIWAKSINIWLRYIMITVWIKRSAWLRAEEEAVQGDTGGRGPGLGWLWFRCSFILFSYPARSAKLPLALAELGRSWNIKNSSQPNPGPRPPVSPCRSPSRRGTRYASINLSLFLSTLRCFQTSERLAIFPFLRIQRDSSSPDIFLILIF